MRVHGQGYLRCCYYSHRAKRVGSEVRRVDEAGELAQLRRRDAVEITRRGQRLRWRQAALCRAGLQIWTDGWTDGWADLPNAIMGMSVDPSALLACSWASVAISAARGGSVAAWNLHGAHTHHAHAHHARAHICMHARDSRVHAEVHAYAQG